MCRGYFPIWLRSANPTTLGTTPLDQISAHHRDIYLITHKTHKRHSSKLPAEFEPGILASELPQTHAWDRTAIHITFDEHKHVVVTDKLQMATTEIGVQIYHLCNALRSVCICQHCNVYVIEQWTKYVVCVNAVHLNDHLCVAYSRNRTISYSRICCLADR